MLLYVTSTVLVTLLVSLLLAILLMTGNKDVKHQHIPSSPKGNHVRVPVLDLSNIRDYDVEDFKVKVTASSFTHEFMRYSHQLENGSPFLVDKFKYHGLELTGIPTSGPLLNLYVYFRNYPFAPLLVELIGEEGQQAEKLFYRSNGDGSFYQRSVGDVLFELDMVVETLYGTVVLYLNKDVQYNYYGVIVDVTKTEDDPAPGYDKYVHDRKFFQPLGVVDYYDGDKRMSGLPTGGDLQNVTLYVADHVPLVIRTGRAAFYPKSEYISYQFFVSNGDGSWTQSASNLTGRQLKIKLDQVKERLVPPQPKRGKLLTPHQTPTGKGDF